MISFKLQRTLPKSMPFIFIYLPKISTRQTQRAQAHPIASIHGHMHIIIGTLRLVLDAFHNTQSFYYLNDAISLLPRPVPLSLQGWYILPAPPVRLGLVRLSHIFQGVSQFNNIYLHLQTSTSQIHNSVPQDSIGAGREASWRR